MTLRCGIIGAGQIAWRYDGGAWSGAQTGAQSVTHASCFARHPDTELVAVHDPLPEARAGFAAGYVGAGAGAILLPETLEAFFALDLDLVAIASPSQYHAEHVLACLDAGIAHLWIEKPVTLDLASFEVIRARMAELPEQPRSCVNYFRRALPQVAALKAHITQSPDLSGCEVVYSRLLEVNGVHMLDLLGHLFDQTDAPPLDWLRADPGGNPDFGLTLNGVPVTVMGHDLPYHAIELRVTGPKGRMALTRGGASLTWEAAAPNPAFPGFFHMLPPEPVPAVSAAQAETAMLDGLYAMLENLLDRDAASCSTLNSAYFAQSLLDRVQQGTAAEGAT